MEVFGLILSIVFYVSQFLLLGGYFVFLIKKNFRFSNALLLLLFLHSLVVIMVLSWALILMNGGFDVNFYLNIDYTWIIAVFVPLFIAIIISDVILQRNIEQEKNILIAVCRYLLPTFCVLTLTLGTILLYFNCNYFTYLRL